MNQIIDHEIAEAVAEKLATVLEPMGLTTHVNTVQADIENSCALVACPASEMDDVVGRALLNVRVSLEITIITNYADENQEWSSHQSALGALYRVLFDTELLDDLNQRIGRNAIFNLLFMGRANETTARAWRHTARLEARALEHINQ